MRLLLDLQGAQGRARGSGLGRYALAFARALAAAPGPHRVEALINQAAEAADELGEAFSALLGPLAIHRFAPPAGAEAGRAPRRPLRLAAERIRAAKVAETGCELLLLGSVWEGFEDPCVTTWPADLARPATAAVLHDLIPLSLPELYLHTGSAEAHRVPWYFRCLQEAAECDLLLANSAATRAEALRHLGPWEGRVAVIGGGVSDRFAPVPPDAAMLARLRDRYGLPSGAVLFLGAGDHRKNHAALIAAHALLPEALRAAHPLAIGHARPWEIEAGAEVIRLPRIAEEDLPAAYSAAAVLCFPSLAEGFGLPLLEAMACGCAVLAGQSGAMPEVLGRDDALFDPRDPSDIARLLRRALEDRAWRAELAASGRRRARGFTWDRVALRALDALEAVPARPTSLRARPRLAVVAARAEPAAAFAARLGGRYMATLATELPPEDPAAERFARIGWPALLAAGSAAPAFERVVHVGAGIPAALAAAMPGAALEPVAASVAPHALGRLAAAPEAAPEALCAAVEGTHLGAAREAAARLLAALPLDAAGLDAARAALDRSWPQA